MIRILKDVSFDWLGKRRIFIAISVVLLLAGLASAMIRWQMGSTPFNLGVDFQGGTLVTVRFPERPSEETIRAALAERGLGDAIV
ncbi:MAG: protein translocase subunit SecF, partial [Acidobacteria bacterium]|nr:protein translocase subunit SecF [Acidobacteriota bacterium]